MFVSVVGSTDGMLEIDTIRHDGRVWLDPNWLDHGDEGCMTPERIVGLNSIRHREIEARNDYGADLLINEAVPEATLSGEPSHEQVEQYEIQIRPDIRFASSPT